MWRRSADGHVEVLLVHRPRYDDWSLPKGKAETGETDAETAWREVEEETGVRPVLGTELASVRYVDRRGRSKVVRYWAMTPADGFPDFSANGEVDALRWCSLAEAGQLLTYPRDRPVLDALARAVKVTSGPTDVAGGR
ncbi:MAG: hypothetical protein NVS3B21_18300 [Acidimicrobiales bacterium]